MNEKENDIWEDAKKEAMEHSWLSLSNLAIFLYNEDYITESTYIQMNKDLDSLKRCWDE